MGTGALRVVPLAGETTWSFVCRVAGGYGMAPQDLLPHWSWVNSRPRRAGEGARADAEVLFDRAGQQELERLSGTSGDVLARALPSWRAAPEAFAGAGDSPRGRGRWQVARGPVAFGCRLCTAARTGRLAPVVRYVPRWQRVCTRHGQWLADVEGGLDHGRVDLRGSEEVVRAQLRWPGVARAAGRAGLDAERVFAVARAVVCQWWAQALGWQRERIWPARLHRVAGGDAGPEFWRWRVVARDAVTFPEVVAVAQALADPRLQDLVWTASRTPDGSARMRRADDTFCRRLGLLVGRPWLGELIALEAGVLSEWMGSIVRGRFREQHQLRDTGWYPDDPWFLRREQQPVPVATLLRTAAPVGAVAPRASPAVEDAAQAAQGSLVGVVCARAYTDRRGRRAMVFYRRSGPFDLGRWLAGRWPRR